jgi:rhamnosyltransferase
MPEISIIIRTKNEERWITPCLEAVFRQKHPSFEVILVDNMSIDSTVDRAKNFPVKIFTIEEFRPGRAINFGIENASGGILVCLSGHCIPVHSEWLQALTNPLYDPIVGGVYGRQQPMSFSKDTDKRDLLTIFGLDRKIQKKDTYFHNANSAFRRDTWRAFKFDDLIPHIEDRIWARDIIGAGYEIHYEPAASVFHFHGVHQDNSPERRRRIVKILESLAEGEENLPIGQKKPVVPPSGQDLEVVALIPVRGSSRSIDSQQLLEIAIRQAKKSKFINRVIVLTDSEHTAQDAKNWGAEVPFLRPRELSAEYVTISEVLKFGIEKLREIKVDPDLCVVVEETYPFREENFLDDLIEATIREGSDSTIAVREESRAVWKSSSEGHQTVTNWAPRLFKSETASVSLFGLGFVTYPAFLRDGSLGLENRFEFVVEDPLSAIEVRGDAISERIVSLFKKFT